MTRVAMVNIGAQNYVAAERVVAVLGSGTAPVRRVIREGKERGVLLDVSQHRELRSLIVLDDGHMVASFLAPTQVMRRLSEPLTALEELDPDE